ncbi:MAG TPA: RsmB/NOP family class I SAM-dependent RNA methyltransferase [Cyclobacteriaceae bacterium]|jgi:16S rRNA (cytosine967-C5)-methyltransferase|nr:RsmB/NOP family class I SAM-dependent RNA methyltransferase [Cyclobacteriaceae bacterium]
MVKFYRNLCEAVVQALESIFNENRYADRALEKLLKQNPRWGSRDRRFIAETTYDIVRWYRLLGYLSDTPNDFWRLMGTWFLLNKNPGLPPWREFSGLDAELVFKKYEKAKQIRAVHESIPDWMDELCQRELGSRWEKEITSLNEEAEVVLRVNTLKNLREELQERLDEENIQTEIVRDFSDALILSQRQNIFQQAAFKEGLFEVQDAGSQAIAPFLNVEPGQRIVDACAGGGGKTLHLAALMQNRGRIIAMDTEAWKLEELKKRAKRAGASNMIETRLIESTKTIKRLEGSADRVLLDVPCSGLGVLKRNPDAKWKLSLEAIEKGRETQQMILRDYSSMLKKGGLLVYSTCSILPSENEKQVERFLGEHKDFQLLKQRMIYPSQGFDGFYMALIKKIG